MQYNERLKSIMELKKASATTISHIIGQSETSVYNYLKGKNEPTISVFTKIINEYSDINAHWLLTGMGEMLLSDNTLQEPKILFGNVNHGVAGQMTHTYNNIGDCEKDLAVLQAENALLKKSIQDKELIISLLTNK